MKYRWSIAPPQPILAAGIAAETGVSPLLAQCLLNRDLRDFQSAQAYLQPRLKTLSDPFTLPDMALAVDRLLRAQSAGEKVVIFGDYDVDGVTSTALLLEVLRVLGFRTEYYLPHRMEEGYGLTREAAQNCLLRSGPCLLLAVDCGSSSAETIAWLATQGIDVIVLDHHQVAHPKPPAFALVNPQADPQLEGGSSRDLCSAGLSFKLAHALVKEARNRKLAGAQEYDLRPLLDLVALGTIADVVPLRGENRIFVSAGLERLATTQRPGLRALKHVSGTPLCPGVYEVGFQLAPRLNAAGRLETAEEALKLLLSTSNSEALCLAEQLNTSNQERQKIEKAIAEEALAAVHSQFAPERDFVIVEGSPSWHIGVVGIVASRVVQKFYRPTIILGGDGQLLRGSGRSIPGFDLAAALRECSAFLIKHGGHAMAAGISLEPAQLLSFRAHFNEVARRHLRDEMLRPVLRLDAEVGLEEITLESLMHLDQVKPTGMGNPALQFASGPLTHARPLQRMGKEKQHVKLWVTDGTTTREAVWWGAGQESLPTGKFHLAFQPVIDEFGGRRAVCLKVLDWRPASGDPQASLVGI